MVGRQPIPKPLARSQASGQQDLWLVDCETKAIQRLTFEPCSDGNPRWSPDGQFLYFTSSPKREAEKASALRRQDAGLGLHLATGRQEPVTRVEGGIDAYCLAGSGNAIYYTTNQEHVVDEWKELRKEFSRTCNTDMGSTGLDAFEARP